MENGDAIRVARDMRVTDELAGCYLVWFSNQQLSDPGFVRKKVGGLFCANHVYRRMSEGFCRYPEDVETIYVEPKDGWWQVRSRIGHTVSRLKRGENMYALCQGTFTKQGCWQEYNFIARIEEPS